MTVKIDQKIVGYKVLTENSVTNEAIVPPLEKVTEDMKRPAVLCGKTYKIKPPGYDSALYMTVNNILINKDTEFEQRYPLEIFLNSKHMESYQWIDTFTRLSSAIFRKGGNITFIVDELEQIFDPKGGYWGKEPNSKKGKFYSSVVAELGAILRQHMIDLGLIKGVMSIKEENDLKDQNLENDLKDQNLENDLKDQNLEESPQDPSFIKTGITCPECGEPDMQPRDGCPTCVNGCGFSKCG